MTEDEKQFKLSPLEFIGRPVFVLPVIDLEEEAEIRKREMFIKAFEDLPKPEPALCRCMIEPQEGEDD